MTFTGGGSAQPVGAVTRDIGVAGNDRLPAGVFFETNGRLWAEFGAVLYPLSERLQIIE
jgi:hypothetical protein